MDKKIIESFDKISKLDENKWNHNNHYAKLMLRQITTPNAAIIDIGCGKGDFIKTALDADYPYAVRAVGIDFSQGMIDKANENCRSYTDSCSFMCGNAYNILPTLKPHSFDAAFCTAAMHHMDYDILLPLVAEKIKSGGVFVVLDILKASTAADYLTAALAVPGNILNNLICNHYIRPPADSREVWDEHGILDEYATLSEIDSAMKKYPYKYRLKRLLYYRYILTVYF